MPPETEIEGSENGSATEERFLSRRKTSCRGGGQSFRWKDRSKYTHAFDLG